MLFRSYNSSISRKLFERPFRTANYLLNYLSQLYVPTYQKQTEKEEEGERRNLGSKYQYLCLFFEENSKGGY